MKLTEELLIRLDACEDGIQFAIRNDLIGIDIDYLKNLEIGDYNEYFHWLRVINIIENTDTSLQYRSSCSNMFKMEYDSSGRVISSIHSNKYYQESITYEYDDKGNLTRESSVNDTDDVVSESNYKYDANNNLLEVSDENGDIIEKYTYTYTSEGKVSSKYCEKGEDDFSMPEYDSSGNIIRCTRPNFEEFNVYDDNGNETYVKTSNNNVITECTYEYDFKGNPIRVKDGSEEFEYSEFFEKLEKAVKEYHNS